MKLARSLTLLLYLILVNCAPATREVSASDCAATRLESVKLLCRADSIRAQRVQYSAGGALIGGVLGGAIVAADGGDTNKGIIAGAIAGALVGYWLNERNAIVQEHASMRARVGELQRRADAAIARRNALSRALQIEVEKAKRVRDLETRIKALENIIAAAELVEEEYENQRQGITQALPPRLEVPPSQVPKMPPDDFFAGDPGGAACNAIIDLGANCTYRS